MSGSGIFRSRSSANSLVIQESKENRRATLTGYANVVLDGANNGALQEDYKINSRLKLAESPTVGLEMSDIGIENVRKRPFRQSSEDRELPINKASFISYLFVTWLSPLIVKMFRNRAELVTESNIWECSEAEGIKVNKERMVHLWKEELEKNGKEKSSFMKVWLRFIRTRSIIMICISTLSALAVFLSSAFLVNQILLYLESSENDLSIGLGLAAAQFSSEVFRALTFTSSMIFGCQTGMRVRSGFMGIIYDKLLKIRSVQGETNSEMINSFSVDSYRVYLVTYLAPYLWSLPVYVVIATVYSYVLIGYWCFVAFGTFALCYYGQVTLSKLLESLRGKCAQYTDLRVKRIGEVLNSIKFIKMYALEKPFNDALKDVRKSERTCLLYQALVNAVISSILPVTPTIASAVTIAIYTAAGNQLKASTAFALIATMNFPRLIVTVIPTVLRSFAEAKVSFARIKRLLLIDEHKQPSSKVLNTDNAVEIKTADFTWEEDPEQNITTERDSNLSTTSITPSSNGTNRETTSMFELRDINFEVKRGKLIGICGSVGSGKSSLVSAMIGRMTLKKGHLAVKGNIAYVAQQAWIFNASLKDNILFGNDFDVSRHRKAIRCCGLDPDIKVLPDGDETKSSTDDILMSLVNYLVQGRERKAVSSLLFGREIVFWCKKMAKFLSPIFLFNLIGERGVNLSGGQKQRVNLARAVYSNSDIFILDDPLSAIDVTVGQQVFHDCITNVLKEKTVLLVTHQLQYLKHCDEVLVIADGKLVEQGPHEELLALEGLYTDMFRTFDKTTITSSDLDQHIESGSYIKSSRKSKANQAAVQTGFVKCPVSKPSNSSNKQVVKEEVTVGDIKFGTYKAYVHAGGGWCVAGSLIFAFILSSGSIVFSDWWLSEWISAVNMVKPLTNFTQNSTTVNTSGTKESKFNDTSTVSNRSITFSYDVYFTIYIVSIVGVIALQLLKGFFLAKTSIKASDKLYTRSLDKVMKAQMFFFDSTPVGGILNRFSKDLDEGDVFLPQKLEPFLRVSTLVLLTVGLVVYTSPWILITMVPVVIVFALMKKISTVSIRQLKRLENVSRSPLISHVNMTSQGLSTVVAYQQQDRFFEKCIGLGDAASVANFLFDTSIQWINLRMDLVTVIVTVSTVIIFVLTKGIISPASAGLVLSLYGKTVVSVQFLVRLACEVEARFTSVERLNEYITELSNTHKPYQDLRCNLETVFHWSSSIKAIRSITLSRKDLQSEPQHATKTADAEWPDKGRVSFRDVVMRYRPDHDPVLRNVTFDIQANEKVGIVGRTGAGKSSLATALFRLVELDGGKIYVDGEDISLLHISTIRSKISTITQEPVLFAGTVRYNVDPFSQYSDTSIWQALERVHIKYKIEQSDKGLDADIEENGENYSVGERQLICLARALLRRSKILLLDEATANIDTSTDALIQDTIKDCFSDCTVITIAHRLNTVLHSDRIIVLDSGQVVECGTPQDLISNPKSFFSSMIRAQSVKAPSA